MPKPTKPSSHSSTSKSRRWLIEWIAPLGNKRPFRNSRLHDRISKLVKTLKIIGWFNPSFIIKWINWIVSSQGVGSLESWILPTSKDVAVWSNVLFFSEGVVKRQIIGPVKRHWAVGRLGLNRRSH